MVPRKRRDRGHQACLKPIGRPLLAKAAGLPSKSPKFPTLIRKVKDHVSLENLQQSPHERDLEAEDWRRRRPEHALRLLRAIRLLLTAAVLVLRERVSLRQRPSHLRGHALQRGARRGVS